MDYVDGHYYWDHPVLAMREKPRASVVEAAKLVKAGRAQAMVSMGSTGAAMASATLVLGLLEGVERPAVGGPLLAPLSQTLASMRCLLEPGPLQSLFYAET
jgi:fatty acid/phospholipid biosynthesis enzyme